MIDTEQADLWEGLEQIRKSCATEAPQNSASVNARLTLGEILIVILMVLFVLVGVWSVLTDSPAFMVCPPNAQLFGCPYHAPG